MTEIGRSCSFFLCFGLRAGIRWRGTEFLGNVSRDFLVKKPRRSVRAIESYDDYEFLPRQHNH